YKLNIEEDIKLIPLPGVYAVSLEFETSRYRGMMNIRNVDDEPEMQIHLFDYSEDVNLRGKVVNVFIHKRMRDELVISGKDELRFQLEKDKQEISELIY
ncbi:MAG: riboflavin kinase, partial [Bacteroidota bacterium]|nr:riboflavin kinase [Bacteroidota bacterium]